MRSLKPYGKELILDLRGCDPATFNREWIRRYFEIICAATGMEAADLHFWDDLGIPENERQTEPHLKGTSAVQFITTSNITIHTLDLLHQVFINFFSCKPFEIDPVVKISTIWFKAQHEWHTSIIRA